MMRKLNKHQFINNLQKIAEKSNQYLISNQKEIISREKKTNIFDAFSFKIQYGKQNQSQSETTDELNKFKNLSIKNFIDRTSYADRSNQLTLTFIKKYYDNLCSNIKELFYIDTKLNNNNSIETIAIDGSKGNMSKNLEKVGVKLNKNKESTTPLTINFFSVTYNSPILTELVTHKNERKAFLEMFNKFYSIQQNKLYVYDRGFFQKKLIETVHSSENFFILRLKSDNLLLNNFDTAKKCNKNIIYKFSDDDMIIKYNSNDLKFIRIMRYKINNNYYYICTNLYDYETYSTEYIKNVYHKRWNIEEYFKFLKENTSFRKLKERSFENIKKTIYCQMITAKITHLIINYYLKDLKKGKIVNKSHVLKSIYNEFMMRFMYYNYNGAKFSRRFLERELYFFIEIITTHLDISVPVHAVHTYSIWNQSCKNIKNNYNYN